MEARSKIVSGLAASELAASVKCPKACRATRTPRCVTAVQTQGNARSATARCRMENAAEKIWSWL